MKGSTRRAHASRRRLQALGSDVRAERLVRGLGTALMVTTLALSLTAVLATAALAEESTALEVVRRGHGPAMLLIPGLSSGGDVWEGTVEALRNDYELHVVTLAGFAGQPPLEDGAPFLLSMRDALIEHIRANGLDRPVLMGHSLGAHLAYLVAVAAPSEVGAIIAVDGLPYLGALQDPAMTPEKARPTAARLRSMFETMSKEQFLSQNELALRTMIRDPAEVARIAESSGRSDPATVGRAMAELMLSDLRPALGAIETPILQIGAFAGLPSDTQRQSMSHRYQAQTAAARDVRWLEAPTLHFVMLDDLSFFLEAVHAFLEEVR